MNPRLRPTKVRSIIFTEACPLDCLYCNFKQSNNFGTSKGLTKEQLFHLVETFDKLDDVNTIDTRILFSGGEPLLRWPWIKEIIEKY
ncbi:MAG: radical SAM protein [Clostridia bacterium]|nr:radical SAM protein [Clostridia bacterium]MBQ9659631.1 radical SAM protein [Clostridia bacterium]